MRAWLRWHWLRFWLVGDRDGEYLAGYYRRVCRATQENDTAYQELVRRLR